MTEIIINVTIKTVLETVYLTGIIILIGFVLGILRNSSLKIFQMCFGNKAIMITGFVGVPVHELSHGIAVLLFGHKIIEVKLFQKPDSTGTMGYVKHTYRKNNIYQQIGNFFIGIAPMFGGSLSIIALMRIVIPKSYFKLIDVFENGLKFTILNKDSMDNIINSYVDFLRSIFSIENLKNPYFYIFLFASICIASHISLSSADIKGASRGLGSIFILLFIINALGLSKFISEAIIIKYNILITGILILVVILSLIIYLIGFIFFEIRKIFNLI